MSIYAMRISKHTPDSCPAFEPKFREAFLTAMEKDESLAAKHKVKIIGVWVDSPGHTVYSIYDTPTMENLMDYTMEPEIMATMSFQTSVIKALTPAKQVAAMVKSKK